MVLLLLLLLAGGQAAHLPSCENALPPGEGFGGSVTITSDCTWRPQLHFINTLTGQERPDYPGALTTPTIFYESAPVSSQAGPGRLSLNKVVLANFSLSSPGVHGAPVLWPRGLLQPGLQPGSTAPRRLYMADVRMIVSAQTIQEYVRFFRNSSTDFWTDNSTFIHLPYWSDDRTTAISVGLLLEVPGAMPVELARDRPPAGRNFVLAADFKTLPTLLQTSAGVGTAVPFLLYLATHVSLTPGALGMPILPVNRPLIVVGKSENTSVDLGMAVNTLQLGPQGSVLFNQVILENLAPGDARSVALAGPFDPMLAYPVWAVGFDRGLAVTPRIKLQNVTMVMADVSLEQYLIQATVFRVRPAGFTKQLSNYEKRISRWEVRWAEDSESVYTTHFDAAAMQLTAVNMTSRQLMARALPLPARNSSAVGLAQQNVPEYQLTHVSHAGLHTMDLVQLGGEDQLVPGARELIMLTSNITVPPDGAEPPDGPEDVVQPQLQAFLAHSLQHGEAQQHVVIGIETPPVTLDLSYTQNLVQLPANLPAGHFAIVNMMIMHLSQGPKAAMADANVLLPDVWTHLLWGIRRETKNVVLLSNTTLWVPAAEFSFIRSHTATHPTSFTINLQGDANMRFYHVQDLRANGLFIQRYRGPGLEAESLTLRVEPAWSMNGQPPRGFWAMQGFAPGFNVDASADPPRMSDTMVVVLAVCIVAVVVVAVLACLAVLFYRKRAAERQRQAQRRAEAESGVKPASEPAGSQGAPSNWDVSGSRGGSGLGILGCSHGARRSPGILPGLLRDSMPVHDSSDSFNAPEVVDRAALTAELAFSKFGPRNLALQDGSDGDSSDGGGGGGNRRGRSYRGRLLPPAAAGAPSSTSMASDACLQRLQSAISVMSQDVLSRRLQYAAGADGSPVGMGAGAAGGLGRPSLLGQQQPWLTPPPDAAVAEDGDQQQQQNSGSLTARSSSSFGRSSMHSASPRGAADADQQHHQQDRAAAGVDGQQQQQHQVQQAGLQGAGTGWAAAGGAAAAAGGGALAKSSYNSSCQSSRVGSSAGGLEQLKLLQLVGQGTFGQVYKALWRRRCVAVKILQLSATAGSSDVPWRGMGRSTSHREKMAIMETVVSTTMSHPNIVQVYTYVLQPLMQGSMSRSRKQQHDSPHASRSQQPQLQQQQQQRPQEVEQLPPQPQLQDRQQQQQQQPRQQQEVELQQQRPQGVQGAAAQLLARITNRQAAKQQQQQQLQPQQRPPPDLGVPPEAEGEPPLQQQQQLERLSCSSHASGCDDSSLSLSLGRHSNKDLSRLTPEMAKAAAAALPAAAFGAAAAAGDGSGSSAGEQEEEEEDHQEGDMPSGPVLVGWQLRLVMEYCDLGSLRTALDHKLLIDRTTGLPALECVLFLAHDVACAMIHLHSEHLLHGDLKASNVLLKRTAPRLPLRQDQERPAGTGVAPEAAAAGGGGAAAASGGLHGWHQAGALVGGGLGLMAKVADFGLSLTLGPTDTHVSQMHMGTLTHMAPELLLHGRASKASDVYAFGILLWELATGRRPYSGTPVGMLAHKVVQQGWRPAWPGGCSLPIKMLVEHCWAQDAADRPCFEQVVQQLEEMAGHLDELKQQQAQAMAAAAAAPLFHPVHGAQHDSEPGHELTPSMMAELMPSGFGPSSAPIDVEEGGSQGSGVLYEMSQLSGGSHDQRAAMHLELASVDGVEGFDADAGGESPDVVAVSVSCSGEVGVVGSRSSGSKHGARLAVVR